MKASVLKSFALIVAVLFNCVISDISPKYSPSPMDFISLLGLLSLTLPLSIKLYPLADPLKEVPVRFLTRGACSGTMSNTLSWASSGPIHTLTFPLLMK